MKSSFCLIQQGGPGPKSLSFGIHGSEKGKGSEKGEQPTVSGNQPKRRPSSRASKARPDGGQASLPAWKDGRGFQHPKPDSSPPSHHRSTGSLSFPKPPWSHSSESLLPGDNRSKRKHAAGSEEKTPKQPPPPLFTAEGSSTLPPLNRSKPEEEGSSRIYLRRGSEPGRQVIDRSSGVARVRLPSDPGLKATEVQEEARFCLSPCAAKAVREYFCAHPCSNPHSGQQVALALVESRREWLKRCNDPTAELDFEQLLFAEESYV